MYNGLHGKDICGNSHSSKRGGEPIDNIPYGTWMNNCGPLFDNPTNADASWLSSGNYDVAFRNLAPTKKTINVFMESNLNYNYRTPSWQSTLIGGIVGLGIQGLGLWGLSRLFRGKKEQPEKQTQQLTGSGSLFLSNYLANLKMPTWTIGSTTKTSTIPATIPPVKNKNTPTVTQPKANFTNSTIDTDGIKGEVTNTKWEGSKSGYPMKFEIHDKSLNKNSKTDDNGNILADIYYFELQNDEALKQNPNTKPKYKCVKAELYVKNKNDVTFNANTFEITSGFSTEKNSEGHYTILTSNSDELGGTTDSNNPTVKNKDNINYDNGTKTTYP